MVFVGLLQCGFAIPSSWPDEQRFLVYLGSPLVLLLVCGLAWYASVRLGLRFAFLTGAVVPIALACATLCIGALLQALGINPVKGFDGWAGWGIVAIAFYPAVTVWYLSRSWTVRLSVFGTVVLMAICMVFYSWTARERWRDAYYAEHTSYSTVRLLEVPGFRMKGINFIDNTSTSPIYATAGYVLEGQGEFHGVSLYVESDLGPGFDLKSGKELVDREVGLDLTECRSSRLVKPPSDKQMCIADGGLVLLLDGTGFHIFWRGPGNSADSLRAVGNAASVHRWSKHDLRSIPLGSAGYDMRRG
ncbi:hypothetical protein [Rhizocola hellebori]|uniref:hypothetical protein n=1 Tax=Rhizocola hellebori TaxID=1392758 RepID=UPI0019433692|nr:hypothetical protein [Rhizocola hellebori]